MAIGAVEFSANESNSSPVIWGASLISITVIMTFTVSSTASLSELPSSSTPSLTDTVTEYLFLVSWSSSAFVHSWPEVESISKKASLAASSE